MPSKNMLPKGQRHHTVRPQYVATRGVDRGRDDEVLRAGPMTPGSTVMVTRDFSGDDDDKPLALEIIPPSKPQGEDERPKVGVGAKSEGDGVHGSEAEDDPDADPDTEPVPVV